MTTSTRQVGEAVAWRYRQLHHKIDGPITGWCLSQIEPDFRAQTRHRYEVRPLIPASDLEKVSRERDEAVRLLRPFGNLGVMIGDGWTDETEAFCGSGGVKITVGELRKAMAFLNNMENRDG